MKGYTLIEMMVVVAIIAILATVSVECLGDTIRAAREATTKGNLAQMRAAIASYVGAHGGGFPLDTLGSLVDEGFINKIPAAYTYYHKESAIVWPMYFTSKEGGWVYDESPLSVTWGDVRVNCIHTDRRGTWWSSF